MSKPTKGVYRNIRTEYLVGRDYSSVEALVGAGAREDAALIKLIKGRWGKSYSTALDGSKLEHILPWEFML